MEILQNFVDFSEYMNFKKTHDLPVGLHQKVVSVGSLWQCLAGIRTEYAKTRVDSEPRSALFYLIAESEKLFSVPSMVRFFYELD